MQRKSTKRRRITLIEIMIVMALIAMILGVVSINYQGSLDKGKVFQTKTAQERVETILSLYLAEHPGEREEVANNWQAIVKRSPLVTRDPNKTIHDGWGAPFNVTVEEQDGVLRIRVRSSNLPEGD